MNKKIKSAYAKSVHGNKLVGALGSTPTPDRDGDVIVPGGIDVKNFMRNPVLLWSHDPYQLPIGKITNLSITGEGLIFDAEFASDISDMAKSVRDMFAGGFLNAFSIGFIPHERDREKITKCELVEISAVNIPANPEALASRSYKSFNQHIVQNVKKSPHSVKIKILKKLLNQ